MIALTDIWAEEVPTPGSAFPKSQRGGSREKNLLRYSLYRINEEVTVYGGDA